jgi:anti-anti-sigma regulatory factor
MLKICTVENRSQRRLVLEGKLVAPWAGELRVACEKARADLGDRELVVDVKNLTAISQAGENVLIELMTEGVKFRGSGVFTKHMLKQLARRCRDNRNHEEKRQ